MFRPVFITIIFLFTCFSLMPVVSVAQTQAPKPESPAAPVKPAVPAPAQPVPPPKVEKKAKGLEIAFFQLDAKGVSQDVASLVSDTLLSELGRMPNTTVIGSKEIDAMIGYEQKKQMVGCTETSCIVAIGGALGVDKIVMGSIGKIGDSYLLILKLLDINKATMEGIFQKRLQGGKEEDFLDAVPEALSTLFPKHSLLWGKREKPAPSTAEKAAPWILVGVGGAAVITGGVMQALAISDHDRWAKMGQTDPEFKSLKTKFQREEISAYVLYGVGAAALAGGLTWYFVVRSMNIPQSPIKKAVNINLVPLLGPTSGAMLTGSW